ncbi:hypothetical protein RHGRI_021354 [Rhododendron griersonianum]|uniref:Uncharacterized protein n=1 Tax=Rhododendron griersonianum TaxID=479676 RepID=A0AAV6JPI5_9ERIC|nr:hypothetical protein RHGRI_021354 [Rhododendron griersonianum]
MNKPEEKELAVLPEPLLESSTSNRSDAKPFDPTALLHHPDVTTFVKYSSTLRETFESIQSNPAVTIALSYNTFINLRWKKNKRSRYRSENLARCPCRMRGPHHRPTSNKLHPITLRSQTYNTADIQATDNRGRRDISKYWYSGNPAVVAGVSHGVDKLIGGIGGAAGCVHEERAAVGQQCGGSPMLSVVD